MATRRDVELNKIIQDLWDNGQAVTASFEDEEDSLEVSERLKMEINRTLSVLEPREKIIIEAYFGINTDCRPMTLEAIGERYNLTKERIRQIKEKAIRKLRNNSEELYNLISE